MNSVDNSLETEHTRNKAGAGAASSPAPTSVWLVEDNRTFRTTLARALGGVEGLDCAEHFASAEDAVEAMQNGGVPDAVLLDVELPGLNGIDAIQKIKSLSPATRVVMLTVFDDSEKVFRAICAGASGYLLKTSPVERIVQSIHEAMAGGGPMSPKIAGAVLQMFTRFVQPKQDYGLTGRERSILELMTQGMLKKEIADALSISYHTVDTHLRNIYTKLHVHSRSGAVAKALKERLI